MGRARPIAIDTYRLLLYIKDRDNIGLSLRIVAMFYSLQHLQLATIGIKDMLLPFNKFPKGVDQ